MELRQLRYFVAVGRQRHFGRAATRLRVAQPALSRQVAKLEAELGLRLLRRHARGVSLTAEGEVLLARAEALLAEADALAAEARSQRTEPQGAVSLGFSPSVAELFGGRLAALSLRRYPKVRLRIATAASPVLETWVQEGRLDAAILNGPTDPSRFLLTPLLEEPLCLIGLRDDPRLAVDRIELAALGRMPLVLTGPPEGPMRQVLIPPRVGLDPFSPGAASQNPVRSRKTAASGNGSGSTRGGIIAAQAQAGQAFVGLAQVENAAIGRQLVLAGVCLMVEVAAVVKAELAAGIAAAVPISDLRIQRYLARARGRGGSDAVARLVSLMRDCVADMVREGAWPSARVLDASLSAAAAYGAEAAG